LIPIKELTRKLNYFQPNNSYSALGNMIRDFVPDPDFWFSDPRVKKAPDQ
jgi:hypothetical protein